MSPIPTRHTEARTSTKSGFALRKFEYTYLPVGVSMPTSTAGTAYGKPTPVERPHL
jgi:hypothetical protein